ncbi:MAG: PST family polysaccharide transporter [Cyclobacteriaceae bacterium]
MLRIKNVSRKFTTIIQNVGWLTLERFFRLGLTLIVGVLVARYLGPAEFEKFSYVLTFVIIIEAISSLGLDNIIVQRIVQNQEGQFEVVSTGFILRLMSLLLLIPFGGLIIYLLREDKGVHLIPYIMLSSLIFRSFDVIDFWFRICINSKYVTYTKLFQPNVAVILARLGILFESNFVYLAFAFSSRIIFSLNRLKYPSLIVLV